MSGTSSQFVVTEEENWREMSFSGNSGTKAWAPPTDRAFDWSGGHWGRSIGREFACQLIEHLRSYPFGGEERLSDIVETIAGRKLTLIESTFFEGLAQFIGRGKIQFSCYFEAGPTDHAAEILDRDRDMIDEGASP